jgi:hypothetical protein
MEAVCRVARVFADQANVPFVLVQYNQHKKLSECKAVTIKREFIERDDGESVIYVACWDFKRNEGKQCGYLYLPGLRTMSHSKTKDCVVHNGHFMPNPPHPTIHHDIEDITPMPPPPPPPTSNKKPRISPPLPTTTPSLPSVSTATTTTVVATRHPSLPPPSRLALPPPLPPTPTNSRATMWEYVFYRDSTKGWDKETTLSVIQNAMEYRLRLLNLLASEMNESRFSLIQFERNIKLKMAIGLHDKQIQKMDRLSFFLFRMFVAKWSCSRVGVEEIWKRAEQRLLFLRLLLMYHTDENKWKQWILKKFSSSVEINSDDLARTFGEDHHELNEFAGGKGYFALPGYFFQHPHFMFTIGTQKAVVFGGRLLVPWMHTIKPMSKIFSSVYLDQEFDIIRSRYLTGDAALKQFSQMIPLYEHFRASISQMLYRPVRLSLGEFVFPHQMTPYLTQCHRQLTDNRSKLKYDDRFAMVSNLLHAGIQKAETIRWMEPLRQRYEAQGDSKETKWNGVLEEIKGVYKKKYPNTCQRMAHHALCPYTTSADPFRACLSHMTDQLRRLSSFTRSMTNEEVISVYMVNQHPRTPADWMNLFKRIHNDKKAKAKRDITIELE